MASSPARNAGRSTGQGRVVKRSDNACTRCRRQKTKCSGSQPCEACKKRKLSCNFDDRDQKILVTRGYIIDLQRQIEGYQRNESYADDYVTPGSFGVNQNNSAARTAEEAYVAASFTRGAEAVPSSEPCGSEIEEQNSQSPRSDPVASTLTNPLSAGPSVFMRAGNGRAYYLGTSSNWSFSRRVLSLAHEYVHHSPVATESLLFDSSTYTLGWDGLRVSPGPATPLLPSLDHAIYLINAVKFHCTQIFHLFDEDSFMKAMYNLYSDPNTKMTAPNLCYIHLLLIVAFGKALVEKRIQSRRPPGSDFFVKALQLLPDTHILSREPAISTEILCCIALYFQCLDFRQSAYNTIGQAMRIALGYGMHTNMPTQDLGELFVERCRRIWWTVYVMDREMTSLMGLPQSINDDDVHPQLPTFSGSVQRSSALGMQIRLSQAIATINRKIYGADGRLNKRFLISTKEVLARIAGLADELRQKFPIQPDKISINGVPKISAHLHLLYHQCIILATRPLLLCFLKIQLESPETYLTTLSSSKTVRNLIIKCMESSQQIITILTCLQTQGLLGTSLSITLAVFDRLTIYALIETFLPYNLEPLSVSTVNFIVGATLDPQLLNNKHVWLERSYEILNDIAKSGSLIAEFRRSELRQIDEILTDLSRQYPRGPEVTADSEQQGSNEDSRPGRTLEDARLADQHNDDNPFPSPGTEVLDSYDLGTAMTTAQMLEIANSIANADTEWMEQAIMEHSIW